MKGSPEGRVNASVWGLKDNFPEKVMAVTIVGDARKFMVLLFPSFLDLKFRLKLVKMAENKLNMKKDDYSIFAPFSSFALSPRFHYTSFC